MLSLTPSFTLLRSAERRLGANHPFTFALTRKE